MAKKEVKLETVNIDEVEILAVGTWKGSKTAVVTEKDLENAVTAFDELTGDKELNYEPPVKLGHDDGQKLLQEDGYPAAGWISSLKKKGDKLVASLKDVPKKIGEIIQARGYKKVSAEFYRDYEIGGKKHSFVIKAVALLGGDIPAVKTLKDVPALYADESGHPFEVAEYSLAEAVSLDEIYTSLDEWLAKAQEAIKGKVGAPAIRHFAAEVKAKLRALLPKDAQLEESLGKQMDKVYQAWDAQFRKAGPFVTEAGSWVREVFPAYVIVLKDAKLYKIPYAEQDGVITFDGAAAEEVKEVKDYVPVNSSPAGDGDMTTKNEEALMEEKLRKLLGLDEKGDVLGAVMALKEKAENGSKDTVALAEHQKTETRLQAAETKLAEKERDERVGKAIAAGKILPAQKAWADEYAMKDPTGFDKYVETALPQVKLGELGSSGDVPGDVKLTEKEIEVARAMGVKQESVIAAKKREVNQ